MKKIIEAKALKTINIHLHTPIAIYINNIYYPNKDTTAIHSHYGEEKNWSSNTINSIEWKLSVFN